MGAVAGEQAASTCLGLAYCFFCMVCLNTPTLAGKLLFC